MCSRSFLVASLLATTAAIITSTIADNGEEFAFDVVEDLEVEFEGEKLVKWHEKDLVAPVGRAFHLVVPKEHFKGEVTSFEAKRRTGKALPSWLLFDKRGGVFWGVPLTQDIGIVTLTVKALGKFNSTEDISIKVIESTEESTVIEKCKSTEENTILTLLIDKNIKAIKPKQRVIAINNIAQFFGLPHRAFMLKPQIQKDDITDSSVVLAGPGNIRSRNSKVASFLQVAVGCDGRLWLSTTSMVHQLKQQAKDGTITEVLGLPLIGWRVKTETKPVVRTKRESDILYGDDGSGDYNDEDEYYDDYEDSYDNEELGDVEKVPPSAATPITLPTPKKTTTSTTAASTTISSEITTHPHRHHHGEPNPSIPNIHHQTTNKNFNIDEFVPVTILPSETEISSSTTTSTTSTSQNFGQSKSKPDDVLNYEENYDYGEYDDEDDDLPDPIESATVVPEFPKKKQKFVPVVGDTESTTTEESSIKTPTTVKIEPDLVTESSTVPSTTTTSTTTTTTTTPVPSTVIITSTTSTTEAPTTFQIVEEGELEIEFTTETERPPTTSEVLPTSEETTVPTTTYQAIYNIPKKSVETTSTFTTSTVTTVAVTSSTVKGEESTTPFVETTTRRESSTTQKLPTTIREVTEIEYHENFDPFVENRLQPMSVIAGKIFRFVLPLHTFKDFEDEYDLTYQLLDSNNNTITNNSWLNFNPTRREFYGLPLEVSKWFFWIKATDKDGGSAQEMLIIHVQQHKLELVVNHEFSLIIGIERHQEFQHYVDWSLKVLRALGKIYNTNMTEITVRRINYTSEPVVFTWSNDSIATNYCPRSEIVSLYQVLTANKVGDPSRELSIALSPGLRVKKVIYKELGLCEQPLIPVTPPTNFSPILRNPVDKVNATVGELLVFKVKDDTFYDPEDVDSRMLNISLLTGERQPIPPDNWLQFDSKNREFFGIPRKAGRSEYQLVCVDSGGLPATDSLEVVVYPPLKKPYNVEFSMNITEIPYEIFINSASLQKKFVEKLTKLFEETSANNFYFLPFKRSYDSTIVTWFNKTLPVNRCPQEEIKRLESVLHNMNDRSIAHKVHSIMEPEFRVSTIKVHLTGNCKQRVREQEPKSEISIPVEETTLPPSSDDYLITFIVPAVIVFIMLFLAAVAAIVLYRRRRMGKMNVEEDGRQTYGNKGIPVIFQEELEEKPEPGTKAPVILKDEKPPLAPPEYSKSGSVKLTDDSEPYQPPPPFTRTQDNGRQSRPKPTPTYRKPPPYVPP
ncbi:uncharacterized protein LOC130891122 [Diorhabda carinulata]|uniref:uncharacterized protein LOC130891122 n=1 Tax=Diorhabda carinulata TaxID=1163345 RepID=UPI0025A19219|nr:uncharacterized protein LOC130891122 [Diorhabda carinulata]XP_057651671.1 uncharacterized protein LOC130891122 [Diorhabda carinulata]XP_057651672.1 uncharacterized protein LOC130891122 [Diorhabda carinulata]XP_057651673.1 uncharacterized protein LOC130891122 [Diorhabda carinulata]XP_057651674.1 uncharacterized protein LOC130891122 [Diorhabda carinulata]